MTPSIGEQSSGQHEPSNEGKQVSYGQSYNGDEEVDTPLDTDQSFVNPESIPALDSYEFVWNIDHPLRMQYLDLKRAMYSKYDALNPDNADLKVIIDQTLILQTQITGIGLMLKDTDTSVNRRDLSFRLIKNMDHVRENMTLLMKYTRREPEKVLTKNLHDARALGNKFKDGLSESSRAKLSGVIKAMLSSRDTEIDTTTKTKIEERIAMNAIEEQPFGDPEE
jgi:hypothetical protein